MVDVDQTKLKAHDPVAKRPSQRQKKILGEFFNVGPKPTFSG